MKDNFYVYLTGKNDDDLPSENSVDAVIEAIIIIIGPLCFFY